LRHVLRRLGSLAKVAGTSQAEAPSRARAGLSRRQLVGAVIVAGPVALALVLLAFAGSRNAKPHASTVGRALAAPGSTSTPQAATASPGAPAAASHAAPAAASPTAGPAAGTARGKAAEVADPQESSSFPAPASVHHAAAAAPTKAGDIIAAGAPSDAEVRHELAQMQAVERAAKQTPKAPQLTPVNGGNSIGGNGAIPIPTNVPEVIQRVVAGANAIADFPYVFGGGHASFVDNAYDCSGSVSYALAAGGLLSAPETSGELESWGAPGPGRYITVYAAAGHTYMYVDGVMYNTAGRSGVFASRWQVGSVDNSGFVARHWPGL
jgi:cell wall-associated NlpC family hydrolase